MTDKPPTPPSFEELQQVERALADLNAAADYSSLLVGRLQAADANYSTEELARLLRAAFGWKATVAQVRDEYNDRGRKLNRQVYTEWEASVAAKNAEEDLLPAPEAPDAYLNAVHAKLAAKRAAEKGAKQ